MSTESTTTETCALCAAMVGGFMTDSQADLPLCPTHWSWWLAKFIVGPTPPCAAHLAREHEVTP